MLGNNLSTLGVSSAQLDNHLNTVADRAGLGADDGEFGNGFGDFENHQQLATRFGWPLHAQHRRQAEPAELRMTSRTRRSGSRTAR